MSRVVLIVEDCASTAGNLEIALAAVAEVEARTAGSAEEALDLLVEEPDIGLAAVITDLDLPKLSGFDLIERLRAIPKHAATPIIVSSGSTDPDSPSRAIKAGANAFFAKPYSPALLVAKLRELLSAPAGPLANPVR